MSKVIPTTNEFLRKTTIAQRLATINDRNLKSVERTRLANKSAYMARYYYLLSVVNSFETGLADWALYNFGNDDNVISGNLLGVVEECGEIAQHYLKARQNIRGITKEQAIEEIIDGVFDIIIFYSNFLIRVLWEKFDSTSLAEAILLCSEYHFDSLVIPANKTNTRESRIKIKLYSEMSKSVCTLSGSTGITNKFDNLEIFVFDLSAITNKAVELFDSMREDNCYNIDKETGNIKREHVMEFTLVYINLLIYSMHICREFKRDWEKDLLTILQKVISRDWVKYREIQAQNSSEG